LSAGADVAFRLGIEAAAALAAFLLALAVFSRGRGLTRADRVAMAFHYWALALVDLGVWLVLSERGPALFLAVPAYGAVFVSAIVAVRRGHARGVVAFAAGVVFRFALAFIFISLYEAVLQ